MGTSIEALTAKFGFPIKHETVNGNLALVYEDVYYGFGFQDDKKVIWKENPSMLELYERQVRYGDSLYDGAKCENVHNG